MPRKFTSYPKSYVKASTSQQDIEDAILEVLNGETRYSLTDKSFTNLAYYMSGYMPDISLRDFIDAVQDLVGNKGLKLDGLNGEGDNY